MSIETTSFQVYRELRGWKNDRMMTERAVESERDKWAEMLKGEMGQDIKDVLSGKIKVKLTFSEVINYKLKFYKNKLKKMLGKKDGTINT